MAAETVRGSDPRSMAGDGPDLSRDEPCRSGCSSRPVLAPFRESCPAVQLGIARSNNPQASARQIVAGGYTHGRSGAGFTLVRFSARNRNPARPGGPGHERCVLTGGDGGCRLVLESAEFDGLATDARHRRGLQHFYATGLAPARRGPRHDPAFHWARPDAVRRHGRGRIRFAGAVQQSRDGQPRQSVRRWHRCEHAHLGIPAAGVVARV